MSGKADREDTLVGMSSLPRMTGLFIVFAATVESPRVISITAKLAERLGRRYCNTPSARESGHSPSFLYSLHPGRFLFSQPTD